MFALFIGLVLAGQIASSVIRSRSDESLNSVSAARAAAEKEMSDLQATVQEDRNKMATAKSQSAGPTMTKATAPLPTPAGSFLDDFYAADSPGSAAIKVSNGRIQF